MKIIERIGKELPDWLKYYPLDTYYARYTPNILAVALKIKEYIEKIKR